MFTSPRFFVIAIPLLYGLAGSLWIILSDFWTGALPVETEKGLIFVWASGVLLWLMQHLAFRKVLRSQAESLRTSKNLEQEQQRLRGILMNLPVLLIATNERGEYVFWNTEAERVLGYTQEEMLNQPGAALRLRVDPEYDAQMRETLRNSGGEFRGWDWRLRAKGGHIRTITFYNIARSVPVPGWNSWAVGVDASEREHLERRLRTVLEHLPVGCFIADTAGTVQYWNPAAEVMFGFSASHVQGKKAEDAMGLTGGFPVPQAALNPRAPTMAMAKNRAGESVYCRWRSIPLHDISDVPSGFLVMTEDITDLVLARESVLELNRDLEARVALRTAELEAAKEEIESFAYSVSHDLRAPLRGISGFSAAVLEEFAGRLPEEAQGYLERIQRASDRMGHLIDDLLKLSRLSRQEPQIQTIDLTALCKSVSNELVEMESNRTIAFEIADGLECSGDPGMVRLLLENLIGNALKFTKPREQGRIEIGKEGDSFFVRDNGVGFDMRFVEKLFKPFQRLHADKDFPGTGIGLATVKRIAAKHGGTARASSTGSGATFTFQLGKA